MKKILFAILILVSFSGFGQSEAVIQVPRDATHNYPALLYKPDDYAATSTKYPLLIFLAGVGENNAPLSNLYNSSSAGGPAYFIEHGTWPTSFTNPADGLPYKFIVVSPQAAGSGWGVFGTELDNIIKYLVENALVGRVDINRIYLTGISAGGAGATSYLIHVDNNTGQPFTPKYKIAAFVPMSEANGAPSQTDCNTIAAAGTKVWGFGDPNGDSHGYNTQLLVNGVNSAASGTARFTSYTGGHCCWMARYLPTYTETFTINGVAGPKSIYNWMLMFSLQASTAPTASAGSAQTITLPTSSVSLSGSATAGSGHSISTKLWNTISGPNSPTISGAATFTPTVSNLIQGTYVIRLTATQDDAQQATSDVTITVNPAVAGPVANAGSNQSITLPTSTVTLTSAASTGTITSRLWTKVSGGAATITTPTTTGTTVTGLVQGTYVFQISLNAGVSTATIVVNVNPAPPPNGCPSHNSYIMTGNAGSNYDLTIGAAGALYGGGMSPFTYKGGDTLVFLATNIYGDIIIDGINGASQACPITIINQGGQVLFRTSHLVNSKFIHWTGSGSVSDFYGFKAQVHPTNNNLGGVGVSFEGRSKCVTYDHIFMHNVNQGVFGHTENTCIDSLIYPNWVMDSLIVHDCKIVGTAHEGMYIGSTSPDNAANSYDPRPVNCNGTIVYPRPMSTGYVHVYNCIVDSTGRGGIQISDARGDVEIDHNTVKHSGMSGVTNQGTAISVGAYTHPYIHDNIVVNTLTWGIASLGGSGTGKPIRIENNSVDSVGKLYTYDNRDDSHVTTPAGPFYAPGQIPGAVEDMSFVSAYFLKTVPILDTDSTMFWIKNNRSGVTAGGPNDIKMQNGYNSVHKEGNIICGNTRIADGSASGVLSEGYPEKNYPAPTFSNVCVIIGPTNSIPHGKGRKVKWMAVP